MALVQVENHKNIVRDTTSNALINTDKGAYSIYMQRVREVKQSSIDFRNAVRDINNLKREMLEIKELLIRMVK